MANIWTRVAADLGGGEYNIDCNMVEYQDTIFSGTLNFSKAAKLIAWNKTDAWEIKATSAGYFMRLAVFNGSLYSCVNDRLYKWNDVDTLVEQTGDVNALFPIAYDSNLYMATSDGTLLRFDDPGTTQVAPKFGSENIQFVYVFNDRLFAGTRFGGLLLRWNDVDAWEQVAPKFSDHEVVAWLAEFNNELYAGTGKGIGGSGGALIKWNGVDDWTQIFPVYEDTTTLFPVVNQNSLYSVLSPSNYLMWYDGNTLQELIGATTPAGSSPISFNNRVYVGGSSAAGLFRADINNPSWFSTYPKAGTVGGASAQFLLKSNIDATAYFVIVPDGASAPSSAQVKAGQDASGTAVASGFSGNTSITASVEGNFTATNLISETAYDAYVVAEGSELQISPSKIDFTTADITGPSWSNGYPTVTNVTSSAATVLGFTGESGNVYFVIDNGAVAPSSAQVKAGQNGAGQVVASGFSGSVALTASSQGSVAASNLESDKAYACYVVAEDNIPNLQTSPTKITFVTLVSGTLSSFLGGSNNVSPSGTVYSESYEWILDEETNLPIGTRKSISL